MAVLESKRPAQPHIDVIAPVYNERENIRPFVDELVQVFAALPGLGGHTIILVNDGSTDGSTEILDACARDHPGHVAIVHLSRNFGMEAAIAAGLDQSTGDAVIILDSDMQDDPAAFADFIAQWRAGYDVAYAVRTERQESAARRALFWGFYRLLGGLAQVHLPPDASNFALMDRRVVEALRALPERSRFLRGLRAWVGFRQVGVPVARRARYDQRTRLGLRGQWRLAMNAIFSFSYVPLAVFRIAGAFALILCAGLIAYALYCKFIIRLEMKAWASLLITMSYLGGVNLLGIGILGEYVARIHDEVKGRPNYIAERVYPPEP